MKKRNILLQLSFVIVVLLALGLAFMSLSDGGAENSAYSSATAEPGRQLDSVDSVREQHRLDAIKEEELMDGLPGTSVAAGTEDKAQKRARAVQRYVRRPDLSLRPSSVTAGTSRSAQPGGRVSYGPAAGNRSGSVSGYSAGVSGGNSSVFSAAGQAVSGRTEGASFSGGKNRGGLSGGIAGVARPTADEKRNAVLAPYLNSLTPEAAKSLERQLTGLSSRVERAVLQAMLPKSRKNANIEKYLQRNSSHNASTGPFAGVMEQLSAQKAGIMNSMNGAFGKDAADEAGKVMDAYQKELAAALSQPGLTREQAAQKTRAIGQKYEKELQNVGEKHALKDFEAKQMEKDGSLQNHLAKAYGADIGAQAESILASWREKDMHLALAGLPEEEYYKQQLENQRARRKELEQMLLQNGRSLQGLQEAEDELERARVEQALKDEEEGKTLPVNHHFDDKTIAATTQDLRRERDEKLQTAQRIYGEEGGQAVNAIYDRYETRMSEIMNSDWPISVKQQEIMKARQKTNEEIASLQRTPAMRQAREKEQVNSTMEQLMQDPGLANATPEQREAFERRARPVLQDMFQRINEVSESDLPDDEKQRRIEALQDRAQRQLSGK